MVSTLTVDPSTAFAAFTRWAELQRIRGKSTEQILRKVMQYWISYAIAKIPVAEPGKIEANLTRQITAGPARPGARSRRTTARADKWRGTLAAAIVAALDYRGARALRGAAFYRRVAAFVSARKYAARHHKAGFLPAIQALRVPAPGGRLPRYSRPPGAYQESISTLAAILIAENFAKAATRPGRPAPKGIQGIAPTALSAAETEVARTLHRWLVADLMAAGRRAGFAP